MCARRNGGWCWVGLARFSRGDGVNRRQNAARPLSRNTFRVALTFQGYPCRSRDMRPTAPSLLSTSLKPQ
jgi:hypothetical protein